MTKNLSYNKLSVLLLTLLCFELSSCELAGLNGYKEAQKALTKAKNIKSDFKENPPQFIISLKKQIQRQWNVPINYINSNELKHMGALLHIVLNKDGSVKEVNVKDTICPTDSEWSRKIFVESAVKAVKNGSPYKLPSEEYDSWKEFNIFLLVYFN